jgi:lysophospholipase L1-like esterase
MKSFFSFGRRLAAVAAATSLALLGPATAAGAESVAEPGQAGPGQAGPVRIMPLGDSITYGVGSSTLDSYRGALLWRLAEAGVQVDYVGSMRSGNSPDPDNEGHKGWTIAQLAARVDDWLATYRPDVILLHIGTNDMVRGNQDAAADLDTLLGKIAVDRPDAQVFVAKIVGLGDYDDVAAQRYQTYFFNAAIPGIVASKGANFHVVDDSGVRGIDMWNREHPPLGPARPQVAAAGDHQGPLPRQGEGPHRHPHPHGHPLGHRGLSPPSIAEQIPAVTIPVIAPPISRPTPNCRVSGEISRAPPSSSTTGTNPR